MFKQKILNTIASHPRLITLGIGFAITLAVGTVLGMTDVHSHTALAQLNPGPKPLHGDALCDSINPNGGPCHHIH
jgi:hypothetical protein